MRPLVLKALPEIQNLLTDCDLYCVFEDFTRAARFLLAHKYGVTTLSCPELTFVRTARSVSFSSADNHDTLRGYAPKISTYPSDGKLQGICEHVEQLILNQYNTIASVRYATLYVFAPKYLFTTSFIGMYRVICVPTIKFAVIDGIGYCPIPYEDIWITSPAERRISHHEYPVPQGNQPTSHSGITASTREILKERV